MAEKSQQTEQATPRRIQKARDEGRFVASRLVLGGLQFSVATAFISSYFSDWSVRVANILVALLRRASVGQLNASQLIELSRASLIQTAVPLAVAGAAVVAIVLASQLFVTQFGLSWDKLTPDPNKLNPGPKLQGMLRENLMSFVQSLVLIPLFLYLVYHLFRDNLEAYLTLPRMSIAGGSVMLASQIKSLLWKASTAFLLVGFVDYARERHRYQKNLKMSKQEVKDEHKENEGNMEVKGRIKRMMRTMHRRRMLKDVKTATAIVVNPTHYSVALRYDPLSTSAPIVVAKGKNQLALRIRGIAQEHYIPIIENPPLARGLYGAVEVGQEIPVHLYRAVAEILAHVFKLMNAYGAPNVRQ